MASPELEQLLLVQERDTTIDQLRHRRSALPERDELRRLEERLAALAGEQATVEEQRDTLIMRQLEVEGELATLEARLVELDKKLYSGTVSASRDLQAMADEVEHLKRRRSTLEDHVLEAMDALEPVEARVTQLAAEAGEATAAAAAVQGVIADAEAAIAAEEAAEQRAREELAATLPPALTDQYERIRAKEGGVGAARLVGASCSGCHLALPAVEVDRLKRASGDTVVLCDQCGRILVR